MGKERKQIRMMKKIYVSPDSESEPSGKSNGLNKMFNFLKNKMKKLSSSFKKFKKSIMTDFEEVLSIKRSSPRGEATAVKNFSTMRAPAAVLMRVS